MSDDSLNEEAQEIIEDVEERREELGEKVVSAWVEEELPKELCGTGNLPAFIDLQTQVEDVYRRAASNVTEPEKRQDILSSMDFIELLTKLIVEVRADERKRADRDHQLSQLNAVVLTDEEIETAHLSYKEIQKKKEEENGN